MTYPPCLCVLALEELAEAEWRPTEQVEGAPPPPSLWSKRVTAT